MKDPDRLERLYEYRSILDRQIADYEERIEKGLLAADQGNDALDLLRRMRSRMQSTIEHLEAGE